MAVAHVHPDTIDPGAQLHCLLAAERLRGAGALTRPQPLHRADAATAIRAALQRLASLPLDVFAQPAVVEAAAAARRALDLADAAPR